MGDLLPFRPRPPVPAPAVPTSRGLCVEAQSHAYCVDLANQGACDMRVDGQGVGVVSVFFTTDGGFVTVMSPSAARHYAARLVTMADRADRMAAASVEDAGK